MVLSGLPLITPHASAVTTAPATPTVATGLTITVVPLRLPADGNSYAAIVVGLTDATKDPSLAFNSTTVYLTSSQADVGTVPNSVVIPAGISYVVANFTTTRDGGVTTVTASAAGYASASAIVDTKVPSGYASQLKLVSEPPNLLAGSSGSLVVQLEDDTGAPAIASSAVNVSITSSSQTTIQPNAKNIIVPAGSDVAFVNFTAGYTLASAFITASASSFTSATATVSVIGASPYALHVSAQPGQVGEKSTGRVVVWLTDQVGRPAIAASAIPITITSSNLSIAIITKTSLTIPAGQTSVIADFTAGSIMGSANRDGVGPEPPVGVRHDQHVPFIIQALGAETLYRAQPGLSERADLSAITVSIVNSTGYPALASTSTTINLTSSATGVGTTTTSVTIPAGSESAVASFSTAYLVGSSVITADAQNLLSAQAQMSTYGPVPASLLVSTVSSSVLANGAVDDVLAVSLEDASSNPAVAPSAIRYIYLLRTFRRNAPTLRHHLSRRVLCPDRCPDRDFGGHFQHHGLGAELWRIFNASYNSHPGSYRHTRLRRSHCRDQPDSRARDDGLGPAAGHKRASRPRQRTDKYHHYVLEHLCGRHAACAEH